MLKCNKLQYWWLVHLHLYVTLIVVVQQGGEKEANRPSRCFKGQVPEACTTSFPSSGIFCLFARLYIAKDPPLDCICLVN